MQTINTLNQINFDDNKYTLIPLEAYGEKPYNIYVRFTGGKIFTTNNKDKVMYVHENIEEWYDMLKTVYGRGLFSIEKKMKNLDQWMENCKYQINKNGTFISQSFGRF